MQNQSVADQIMNPQRFGNPTPPQKKRSDANVPNWRMGKFHNDEEDFMLNEEGQYEKQENTLFSQLKIQEKPMSKHAARRKRKKNAQVVVSQPNPPPGGPIFTDADPSLDDLK